MSEHPTATSAAIPMKQVGPIAIRGPIVNRDVSVPLATFETPLWPSTNRGARLSRLTDGIQVHMLHECMTRSFILEANNTAEAIDLAQQLKQQKTTLEQIVATTSAYAQFDAIHIEVVAKLLYIRLAINGGDASGHNMVTKAAQAVIEHLLATYPQLKYVSISGNYCTDKKVSAVNGILGRGKHMIADMHVSHELCQKILRTTPEALVDLHLKKNLIGSTLAGSLRSANAHFANMLLAIYLATGQDAANIIEGSQGIVHAAVEQEGLYFSVTLPNLIVGTVGNGKTLPFVSDNLQAMGIDLKQEAGQSARELAAITAATVLCGEISLLAAQSNPGELVSSHLRIERRNKKGNVTC